MGRIVRLARSPEALFGAGVAALGVFVLAAAEDILSPAPWGPALMPRIVGAGLLLLGLATVAERLQAQAPARGDASDDGGATDNDWRGFAWILASLAAFGLLVGPVGFPLAAALLFACVARGFGSPRSGRDFVLGLALALAATLLFAHFLGLPLSWGGALESILRSR
ncbi:MAG: tripartite tricarboxylate transporter TctB family protein [Alphaproteobacteria bacterium]|nr:tripartite tricarboxylate transporter TctB family protein [Alphaproteobacteria bacterium]MBM3949827.1 tripartite tricarboxylate transporter TctB family protein [Rhodospirillales bacterium]